MKPEAWGTKSGGKISMAENRSFHERLKDSMNEYAHSVFKTSKRFPEEEKYGVTSQLRRAALSVILNYIEGYARNRNKVHKNFLEISYGSLQESKYLLTFSLKENYLSKEDHDRIMMVADRIGAMLWGTIKNFKLN